MMERAKRNFERSLDAEIAAASDRPHNGKEFVADVEFNGSWKKTTVHFKLVSIHGEMAVYDRTYEKEEQRIRIGDSDNILTPEMYVKHIEYDIGEIYHRTIIVTERCVIPLRLWKKHSTAKRKWISRGRGGGRKWNWRTLCINELEQEGITRRYPTELGIYY